MVKTRNKNEGTTIQELSYSHDRGKHTIAEIGGNTIIDWDKNGTLVQHLQYMPFGEVFIDKKVNNFNTPYKFNGKEFDSETGFTYYGARYYLGSSPDMPPIFGSVDPLADKYPGISPYAYCNNNPLKYVDPDGRWPWEASNVRNARQYSRQNGGGFNKWEEQNGQAYASVDNGISGGVEAKVFQPTNDSWGNKLGGVIPKISIALKDGIRWINDNGIGKIFKEDKNRNFSHSENITNFPTGTGAKGIGKTATESILNGASDALNVMGEIEGEVEKRYNGSGIIHYRVEGKNGGYSTSGRVYKNSTDSTEKVGDIKNRGLKIDTIYKNYRSKSSFE